MSKERPWERMALLLVITLAVFYFLFRQINIREVGLVLSRANLWYVLVGFLLTLTFPFISALRWKKVLATMGYKIDLKTCTKVIIGAWPLGTITPSKSGELVKAYFLKDHIPVAKTLGSVITERVIDVFSLTILSLIGAVVFKNTLILIITIGILIFLAIFFIAISKFQAKFTFFKPKWQKKIDELLLATKKLIRHPLSFTIILFYTFLNWFGSILQTYFLFLALGISIPILFTSAALPIAIFVGLLPITIAGMGTRDTAIVYLFSRFVPQDVSLGVGILYTLLAYYVWAILGLPFMRKIKAGVDNPSGQS